MIVLKASKILHEAYSTKEEKESCDKIWGASLRLRTTSSKSLFAKRQLPAWTCSGSSIALTMLSR